MPFTFDLFENSTWHFLDIHIASDGLGIYKKRYFNWTVQQLRKFRTLATQNLLGQSTNWLRKPYLNS